MKPLHLILPPETFAVCRLAPDAAVPPWATAGSLWSITRTTEELSVVCLQAQVPADVRREDGWRCIRVAGAMDFSQVGILASLVGPLAEAGISVFAISTFDTDYLLVKQADLDKTIALLRQGGHTTE